MTMAINVTPEHAPWTLRVTATVAMHVKTPEADPVAWEKYNELIRILRSMRQAGWKLEHIHTDALEDDIEEAA